jgi:hypothetical protein
MGITWWLSFAGDEGFRGVALVEGETMVDAVKEAHRLRINPGGEVMGVAAPPHLFVPHEWRNRLLTKSECEELDRLLTKGKTRGLLTTKDVVDRPEVVGLDADCNDQERPSRCALRGPL